MTVDDEIADHKALRREIRDKYRDVAIDPDRDFEFYTGRPLAARLGYPSSIVDALPDRAVESFAGVNNPFSLRHLRRGERVVDVGSGAGFDAFVAAGEVGDKGRVIGIDMTPEMVAKSRASARRSDGRRSSSAKAWPKPCLSKTAGPMWSSPTARSISAQTRGRCSPRFTASCDREERCNSPTSPTGARCRPRLSAILICGPLESRVGCPVRADRRCSKSPASPAWPSGLGRQLRRHSR
jgi:hypothetical protein